jgi:hypothetical protein
MSVLYKLGTARSLPPWMNNKNAQWIESFIAVMEWIMKFAKEHLPKNKNHCIKNFFYYFQKDRINIPVKYLFQNSFAFSHL